MKLKVINTEKAPKAIGPYVQGILAKHFLFVSGQIPLDPNSMQIVSGDIREQTRRSLENIKAIIEQAGGTMNNVVRCGVYLKNMDDFAAMNEVYSEYFSQWKPTRFAIAVAALPKNALIEIEAIVSL